MKVNSRSIYGCTQAPPEFKVPENSLLTYNPLTKRLYIHLLDYPLQRFILEGYDGKIKYAQFLHDASEIQYNKPRARWSDPNDLSKDLNLVLPVTKPNVEIPVIEIFLN
jgi:alpha-L-fucosidase